MKLNQQWLINWSLLIQVFVLKSLKICNLLSCKIRMEHSQKQVYEQIQDDQDQTNQPREQKQTSEEPQSNEANRPQSYLSTQQKFLKYEQPLTQQHINQHKPLQQTKPFTEPKQINHQQLGKYAKLQQQNEDGDNIKISITKSDKKGGIVSYYFVYVIDGYDTKGSFSIARRFNQFFQMRSAIVGRWPGCFVPSIPAKNAFQKNDVAIIKKRTRYLNHFVKKIAKLPHLYYSEEFQTLLRSQQPDVSEVYTKWPAPSSQSIINKYRVNFSELAGKEINYETTQKINDFSLLIKKNQLQLVKERQVMKNLAESYDKVLGSYGQFFTHIFPTYEKECFSEYCGNNEAKMLYMNDSEIKLQEHQAIATQAMNYNPFWAFYDLIRHEERDAMAFSQVLQARSKYETKKHSIDIKISENQKQVAQLAMGKKSFSAKGTSDEIKYKVEVQTEELKRQRENVLIIIDIITAMIAYIEIERYKSEKQNFYIKTLARMGSNQITSVQNLAEIWNGIKKSTESKLGHQS